MTITEYTSQVERTHTISVPSYSTPGVRYDVNLETNSCKCPRYEIRKNCIKHPILGEALAEIRRSRIYTTVLRELLEEEVTELCRRIFSSPRCVHPVDSYNFYLEVLKHPYSTERMRLAARNKHRRNLALYEEEA